MMYTAIWVAGDGEVTKKPNVDVLIVVLIISVICHGRLSNFGSGFPVDHLWYTSGPIAVVRFICLQQFRTGSLQLAEHIT